MSFCKWLPKYVHFCFLMFSPLPIAFQLLLSFQRSFFFLLRLIRDFKTKQARLSMRCAHQVTQPTILLILTQILAFCLVTIALVQLFWFNWLLLQDISAPKLVEISFEFPKLQVPHWPFVHYRKFWLIVINVSEVVEFVYLYSRTVPHSDSGFKVVGKCTSGATNWWYEASFWFWLVKMAVLVFQSPSV